MLLRLWKRGLISASRLKSRESSRLRLTKFFKIRVDQKLRAVKVNSLLMTEGSAKGGNVLLVLGTSNWLNFVPAELKEVEPV